ncbi:MAG: thymidylate synthase [Parcubacteria group bacterium]|nr:thymidylate synthase [Parcubacteria group bacterium]
MKQYLDIIEEIMEKGIDRPDRTGIGSRMLFERTMRFDLSQGFPIITAKKVPFNLIKAELLWFIKGSSDIKELHQNNCHIWDDDVNTARWRGKGKFEGDAGRIYGVQWRDWRAVENNGLVKKIDQLNHLIKNLKNDPLGRRHILTTWNPGELDQMVLPPCHDVITHFSVVNNKLSMFMYQRSCDMFLGVPFNISSSSLFLCLVAQAANFQPGEFIHQLGDAHIYLNHFAPVQEMLTRKDNLFPLPKLWLNPAIKSINDFGMEDIELKNYKFHPAIKAPLNVGV